MIGLGRRTAPAAGRLALALALAVSMLLPVPAIAGSDAAAVRGSAGVPGPNQPAAADAPASPEPDGPSIHALEAAAHAGDLIDFAPGDRVSVGFSPRPGDRWNVGDRAPVDLPPGRVSGHELRDARQGSTWTGEPPARRSTDPTAGGTGSDAPVDGPIGPTVAASNTSASFPFGSGAGPVVEAAPVNPDGLRREVFGFLPYWELSDSSTTLDWTVLSTIAYFSVGASADGNLLKQNSNGTVTTGWSGWTSSRLTSVINTAHQHGTRVVLTISVFAWTTGQQTTQSALLASATARANLAKQAAAAVAERGADGINLDFEPIVSGHADDFTAFVRSVRTELDAIAPGYQLTFDTTGRIGNYPIENATAPGGADAIFIMGYDYRGSSSSQAGSISPLSGPPYDLTDTVSAYAARVSPSKVILGVPYYGRAWSTDTDAVHAKNISGTQYGSSVTVVYGTAVDYGAQYGRRFDAVEQAPWTAYQKQTCTTTYGCVTAWRELYYDDAASLKLRYDLVNRAGLRGAGIWALGYDGTRPELYQALADKFLRDTTAPVVGIDALSVTQRDTGFEVSWAGRDESTIVNYDIQVATDGGPWTDWLVGTPNTSAIYRGQDGHAHAFRARASDSHGNVSGWTSTSAATEPSLAVGGFGTVLIDGLKLRSAAGTSAAILGTLSTHDAVAITGGPVSADGYTWYEVTAPVRQWSPLDPVQAGAWVAVGSASTTYVAARRPINATGVDAVLHDYRAGTPTERHVTPNGDGDLDTIDLAWSSDLALDSLVLNVFGADGALVGSRSLDAIASGQHALAWDARLGGVVVPDGTYVLQLVGTKGGATYTAPSAKPVSVDQVAAFGVVVDHLPVSRLAGNDRYGTAAAISAATFKPGVPVVYLATGLNFPDALAGAAAAGATGGPLLLVTTTTLPPATAAELARLKPARIVLLGSKAVVASEAGLAAEAAAGG